MQNKFDVETRSRTTCSKGEIYHYMIANPPYGVDSRPLRSEGRKFVANKDVSHLPRQIRRSNPVHAPHVGQDEERQERGSSCRHHERLSFVHPDADGESEIRRYVLENDLLEAIVALPEQIFYNTGSPPNSHQQKRRASKGPSAHRCLR